MKSLLLSICAFGAFSIYANANFSIRINNPQKTWQGTTQGIISDPVMTVTPKGVYAEVEFTFTMSCQNTYSSTDTLESVVEFDLPANSFINNSWLWLDNNTIIQASIIERGRAMQIYNGIVVRRRDPSLLLQTGTNTYQLSVFPLTTNYPRKVKIVYSVPFYWVANKANLLLMTDILNMSFIKPPLTLKVRTDNVFTQPYFTEQAYTSFVTGSTTNEQTLSLPYSAYESTELTLNYIPVQNNGLILNNYPTGLNSGIYQMVINPANVVGQVTPKYAVFIIDHESNYGYVHSYWGVRAYIRSILANNFNSIDSFNVYYVDYNGVVQRASTGWLSADMANIQSALNSMPSAISSTLSVSKYEELLKKAILFCKNKPGNDAQVIMVTNGSQVNTQALADTTFNHINSYIGGFSNKIQILSNNPSGSYINTIYVKSNELLYSKLSLASGGNYYTPVQTPSTNSYTLDIRIILKDLYRQLGNNLTSYSITVPVTAGFAYSRYDVNRYDRFSTSVPYVETGKYVGTLNTAGNVDVQLLTASGILSSQLPVSVVNTGTAHNRQTWSYHYIQDLKGLNTNNVYTNEIIDSSIRNRVLCSYTAFLALETGDTVQISQNDNGPGNPGGGGGLVGIDDKAKNAIRCYPNPFTSEITIEFIKPVLEIMIFDITGRMIFNYSPANLEKKFSWNGRDRFGTELPAGIYLIKARTAEGISTIKVMKQ
jgi:hypothetical protein